MIEVVIGIVLFIIFVYIGIKLFIIFVYIGKKLFIIFVYIGIVLFIIFVYIGIVLFIWGFYLLYYISIIVIIGFLFFLLLFLLFILSPLILIIFLILYIVEKRKYKNYFENIFTKENGIIITNNYIIRFISKYINLLWKISEKNLKEKEFLIINKFLYRIYLYLDSLFTKKTDTNNIRDSIIEEVLSMDDDTLEKTLQSYGK